MYSATNQRLRFFINSLQITATQFALEIGTSQPSMSAILSGKRPISRGMAARIKKHYPQLNISWLENGQGDMLASDHGGVNQFIGHDGNIYNNSSVMTEKVSEDIVEVNAGRIGMEVYRLKAMIFDRDEEIKELKRQLAEKDNELKTLQGMNRQNNGKTPKKTP